MDTSTTSPKASDVDIAQAVMKKLIEDQQSKNLRVTTSQIRKFLTAVNAIDGRVKQAKLKAHDNLDRLPSDISASVKFLKVQLAYQIGRAQNRDKVNPVKEFEREANLMNRIDSIKDSVEKFDSFARYVEALVAFHKFYGGSDK